MSSSDRQASDLDQLEQFADVRSCDIELEPSDPSAIEGACCREDRRNLDHAPAAHGPKTRRLTRTRQRNTIVVSVCVATYQPLERHVERIHGIFPMLSFNRYGSNRPVERAFVLWLRASRNAQGACMSLALKFDLKMTWRVRCMQHRAGCCTSIGKSHTTVTSLQVIAPHDRRDVNFRGSFTTKSVCGFVQVVQLSRRGVYSCRAELWTIDLERWVETISRIWSYHRRSTIRWYETKRRNIYHDNRSYVMDSAWVWSLCKQAVVVFL